MYKRIQLAVATVSLASLTLLVGCPSSENSEPAKPAAKVESPAPATDKPAGPATASAPSAAAPENAAVAKADAPAAVPAPAAAPAPAPVAPTEK